MGWARFFLVISFLLFPSTCYAGYINRKYVKRRHLILIKAKIKYYYCECADHQLLLLMFCTLTPLVCNKWIICLNVPFSLTWTLVCIHGQYVDSWVWWCKWPRTLLHGLASFSSKSKYFIFHWWDPSAFVILLLSVSRVLLSLAWFWRIQKRLKMNRVSSLLSMCCLLLAVFLG